MRDRTAIQTLTMLYGAVFLALGILGFIPGITTSYGDMTFAGHDSGAQLLGLFQVSILHNLVHVLFGIAGLALASSWQASRAYMIGGGVIYLGLWLYGLLIDKSSGGNFVPFDGADDWLHFGLGISMILLGYLLTRGSRRPVEAY
jgi:Domain of unknown function (DUF4383)